MFKIPNLATATTNAPIDAGTYEVQCRSVAISESKAGNQVAKLECSVLDEPFEGRLLWFYLTESEAAAGIVKSTCDAFEIAYTDEGEFDPYDFQEQTAKCKVVIETYNGEPVNRIKKWIPRA